MHSFDSEYNCHRSWGVPKGFNSSWRKKRIRYITLKKVTRLKGAKCHVQWWSRHFGDREIFKGCEFTLIYWLHVTYFSYHILFRYNHLLVPYRHRRRLVNLLTSSYIQVICISSYIYVYAIIYVWLLDWLPKRLFFSRQNKRWSGG